MIVAGAGELYLLDGGDGGGGGAEECSHGHGDDGRRPLVFLFAGADGGRGTFGLRGGGANSKGDGGEGFCYADEGGVGVVGE